MILFIWLNRSQEFFQFRRIEADEVSVALLDHRDPFLAGQTKEAEHRLPVLGYIEFLIGQPLSAKELFRVQTLRSAGQGVDRDCFHGLISPMVSIQVFILAMRVSIILCLNTSRSKVRAKAWSFSGRIK